METPQQAICRLLTALETLTQEEEHLFERGHYVESTEVQRRAMPLVTRLAGLLVGPDVARNLEPALQARLQTLLENRNKHYERLNTQLEATRVEIEKITALQSRARRLRPVYGDVPAAASFAAEG